MIEYDFKTREGGRVKKIGLVGAIPEEISAVTNLLTNNIEETIGISVVVPFSRWRKVAAATTVTTLIERYEIT